MTSSDNIKKLFKETKIKTNTDTDKLVLDDAVKAMSESRNKAPVSKRPNLWSVIMTKQMTKLAVSVVVIIAVIFGVNLFLGSGTSVSFADVVQPILDAQTAIMDIIIGPEGKQVTIHDEIRGSRIRRTVSNIKGPDIIIDLEQMNMLTLDHAKKTAVNIKLDGLGNLQNYMELLKDIAIKMLDGDTYQVEDRGLQEIDGQEYLVFICKRENEVITIRVDPDSALPKRIEQKTGNMLIVCDNLEFDVELDESLFSMKVPDNYIVQESAVDFKKGSEKAFIETLRIWAEIIEDGQFPKSINLGDIVKVGPKFDKGLKRANLSDQQQLEVATKFGQGLVFIRFFKGQGKWHYAGQGVELGDGNTPIFWYQPKDSETWRVIYGDLSVKDVIPDDLP